MDVLEDYLDGKLDAKAMYQVEKLSLEDPFVAEALAGLSQSPRRSQSLSILQKQLQERIAQKPVEQKRWRITSQRLSIASAAAVLFITVSILFWLKGNKSQEELAKLPKKVEVNIAPQIAKDKTVVSPAPIVKDEVDKAFKVASENQLAKNKAMNKSTTLPAAAASAAALNETNFQESLKRQEMAAKTPVAISAQQDKIAESNLPANALQGKVAGLSVINPIKQQIRGKVIAIDNGEPLPGVKVTLLNTKNTATTNANGEFNVMGDSSNKTISVAALGFKTKQVNIDATKPATITLEPDQQSLNEVVVTGYGVQKKQSVTSSSTVILPQAMPINGWDVYQEYLIKNKKLSTSTSVGKTVELTFKVGKKGNPTNIRVFKSQGSALDKEAIRLLKEGPKWIYDPKILNGKLAVSF